MQNKVNIFNLGAAQPAKVETITINDIEIKVQESLSYRDIVSAIEWGVNTVIDDRTFVSAPLAEIIETITILKFYTDIDFSVLDEVDFKVEAFYELYDQIKAFDIDKKVDAIIDPEQNNFLCRTLKETLHAIVKYRNSTAGILEVLSNQKVESAEDIEALIQSFTNTESGENLKTIMKAIGSMNN